MTYTCMINPTYTIQQSIPTKKRKEQEKENISLNRENPGIKE